MPPIRNIRNIRELKQSAKSRNFLNNGYPEYQTVNRFALKLMDLQDKLKNTNEKDLRERVGKYSRDLMSLQMHDSPITKEETLSTAITDVIVDLPYYLKTPAKGGDEKTGYQTLVEMGEKYGTFTKAELDEALILVGRGMGVDMGLEDPEKQKQEEEKENRRRAQEEQEQQEREQAERQAVIDAQANIALLEDEEEQKKIEEEMAGEEPEEPVEKLYTDKWLKQHHTAVKQGEGQYRTQGPVELTGPAARENFLRSSAGQVAYYLRDLGVLKTGEEEYPPEQNGVPSVFIMKDNKISTLQENGLWMNKKSGYALSQNPEFAKAVLRGEVFAYLPGERYPVQLQADTEGRTVDMKVSHSAPLKPGEIRKLELPQPPELTREPRWYHRVFQFWGNNRKICQDYAASVAAREKWEKDMEKYIAEQGKAVPESEIAARGIEAKYGKLRTKENLGKELNASYQQYKENKQALKESRLAEAKNHAGEMDLGIAVAENVYGSDPQIREEWVNDSARFSSKKGYYTREDFKRLTKADIDPSGVQIGGKPLSEREFATLAMYGSLDPKLGVQAQREAVSDPTKLLEGLQADGYTREEAEMLVTKSVCNAYTVDVLHTDSRMDLYFNSGVNGGRKRAEEALKAYPQDKTKLAELLADGIGFAAEQAGVTSARTHGGDIGIDNLVKLSGDMIDLMERDPELKQLAQQKFAQKEEAFCSMTNKAVGPFAQNGKGLLKPRTFEECIQDIQSYQKFVDLQQKGLEAETAMRKADAEGKELTQEEKKGYLKDILKSNMVSALYQKQKDDRVYNNRENGVNAGIIALNKYTEDVNRRILEAEDDEDEREGDILSKGGGSSLPGSAPTILQTALERRFIEKAPAVQMLNQPKRMEELDRQAEQIIEQDGLDKMDLEDLNEVLYHDARITSPYWENNMILRTAKLAEPQLAGPEAPQLQKQQDLGQEQIRQEDQILT